MELTFLGTGTSQGIPIIACDCEVCLSRDPRNRRTRTSALVSLDGHNVLIDATPELRLQCLENNIQKLETVLITHSHADHIFGLDDIRRFNQILGRAIDVYADRENLAVLKTVFGYAQAKRTQGNPDLPQLIFKPIDGAFSLFGHKVTPLPLRHGLSKTLGYRIGPLAYCTDVSDMPDEIIKQLSGLDLLVLGALRYKPHPAHLSVDQAVNLARRIGAKQNYFVHMSHHINHAPCEAKLPLNIKLAYDGLKISL